MTASAAPAPTIAHVRSVASSSHGTTTVNPTPLDANKPSIKVSRARRGTV